MVDRFVRVNEGEYEEVLRRFRKSVNLKKIKDLRDFQDEVKEWSHLKKGAANRLTNAFMDILQPYEKPRRVRRKEIEEIVPKRTERRMFWNQAEIDVLREERRGGRGYAKRAAIRLGRTLSSIYKKQHRLKK